MNQVRIHKVDALTSVATLYCYMFANKYVVRVPPNYNFIFIYVHAHGATPYFACNLLNSLVEIYTFLHKWHFRET